MGENNKKIKILWFVNTAFPAVEKYLGREQYLGTGWWMKATIEKLCQRDDVEIAVAWASDDIQQYEKIQEGGMSYYLIPQHPVPDRKKHRILSRVMRYVNSIKSHKYTAELNTCIQTIEDFQPDLVHVWGTENFYGLMGNMIDVPTLIRFQGLLHVIKDDYWGKVTWFDRFSMFNEFIYYINIVKRAKSEIKILKHNKYFEGRTLWDHSHLREYNETAMYFDSPEMMRTSFYSSSWTIDNINRHTIYITARTTPLKGILFLVEAMNILRKYVPDVQLRIGGQISNDGYGKFIRNMITERNLNDCITFLGPVPEDIIVKEMLQAHVYVLTSYIENSCNSLIEGLMVGVPCVASYVGGIPSLMKDEETGLFFQKGDGAMLAMNIRRIFDDDELALKLSRNARESALSRYDSERIVNGQLETYHEVLRLSQC